MTLMMSIPNLDESLPFSRLDLWNRMIVSREGSNTLTISPGAAEEFIRARARVDTPPLTPEIRLWLGGPVTELWEATEAVFGLHHSPPPYWAYAWPGGQALARHVLDHPEIVRGRRVLDFASGCGVSAVAAALAGAESVIAVEIDPLAIAATRLAGELNDVTIDVRLADVVGDEMPEIDVVLAGDICYERPMTERVMAWLRRLAARGCPVLLGDPGRAYLPREGLEKLAVHTVPTTLDLEDRTERVTSVWRLPG